MNRRALLFATAAAALRPGFAVAEVPRLFQLGTMRALRETHAGRPFVLALWSVHCAPCIEDLPLWKQMRALHPGVPIVLVAADPAEEAPRVTTLLARYGLGRDPGWIFGEAYVEKLRFAIDRTWRGELPRTYFHDREHRAHTVTGRVDTAFAEAWFAEAAARIRP